MNSTTPSHYPASEPVDVYSTLAQLRGQIASRQFTGEGRAVLPEREMIHLVALSQAMDTIDLFEIFGHKPDENDQDAAHPALGLPLSSGEMDALIEVIVDAHEAGSHEGTFMGSVPAARKALVQFLTHRTQTQNHPTPNASHQGVDPRNGIAYDTVGRAFLETLKDPNKVWRDLPFSQFSQAMADQVARMNDHAAQAQEKDEVTGITPTTDYLAGINASLRAIANIPMVDTDAQVNGHEDAYRAVEALAKGAVDETVRVQDVWEWAGGNPGIQASREDLKQALNDLDAVCDEADARPSTPPPASQGSAAVAAVAFALQTDQGMDFLRLWNEGEFDALRREWPEAPESIYIGADPLHKPAPKRNAP